MNACEFKDDHRRVISRRLTLSQPSLCVLLQIR